MRALTVDVGSSSIRTALVSETGAVEHVHRERVHVTSPRPGDVELDAAEIAELMLALATRTIDAGGSGDVVAITNQRATTVVFDVTTGRAVGPALSWQDLRTVIDCLVLQGDGVRLAPNQSATKIKWLVDQTDVARRNLRFATLETWVAWQLSRGSAFVTDRSNAGVTGLVDVGLRQWNTLILDALDIDPTMLGTLVDTMGTIGVASALPGSPPIAAMVGDQPASLFGQSCVRTGGKITFGTGAILDVVSDDGAPAQLQLLPAGCYPTVLRSRDGVVTWGVEGIVLSAGSCVEWLCDLGVLDSPSSSSEVATSVNASDGVWFVPAFAGLGTPRWDFGARGAFFGLTRGTTRAHLCRAVLEGVAHRGVDLLDAARLDTHRALDDVRIDGGMSASPYFVQRLADFSGRPVAVSSEREATTRGAGLMALVGAGHLSLDDVEGLWSPSYVAVPSISEDERLDARTQWTSVVARVEGTIPELSSISF